MNLHCIHLEHPDRSALAEHIINLGHHIQLQDTTILCTESIYIEWMIRETTETDLHLNSMNREGGLHLSQL
jgi:hypothetical protein